MNKIIFPLRPRMQGPKVGDLQTALQMLLERSIILSRDEGARRELSAALHREHAEQTYGNATRKAVSIFQEERQLGGRGEVDEPTAAALNVSLEEQGGFHDSATYRVEGRVTSRVSASVGGLRVLVVDKAVGDDRQ